jgi:hypothetical protein
MRQVMALPNFASFWLQNTVRARRAAIYRVNAGISPNKMLE